MRFIAAGPSIPDDLLLARDQGRVIFFCGAGVSRARANLPDFFGLAEKVIAALGVLPESPAFKLIREAQEIDKRIGVSGLISADRVFGLLEREFLHRDIESAVASALKPAPGCDLSAHNTLLDLATTAEGAVRLVTTNFDRLFDDCGRNLQTWQPPRLPDPLRPAEMNGIVYLHGKATPKYDGAEGDGFVLSSSEFGRAYLSDGWATSFFREIVRRYVVVFVGYTADDPPVQYLLEALNKTSGRLEAAYAFQSGGPNDAASRWRHKGVEAIAYDAADSHAALWRTLEAWAERAKDPDRWYSNIIQTAKRGPETLLPHERGQIAHVVSTYEGVKKFSEGDDPPPAEWLCVFDPYRRYAKPGHLGRFAERGPYVDPFDSYGIDADIPPNKIDPEDYYSKRELPSDAWDAFALNRLDRQILRDDNLPSIRGHWAANAPRLTPRLGQLGTWITKVIDQPATVWWAAHQTALHSDIQNSIQWSLGRSNKIVAPEIRQAWRFLFEAWKQPKEAFDRGWYELAALIAKDGWDSAAVRQYANVRRPYFEVAVSFWGGPKPPDTNADLHISNFLHRDVKYPVRHDKLSIPDGWLTSTIIALRQNLELAIILENEIGGFGLATISPLIPDDSIGDSGYERTHGISATIIEFSSLFSRLTALDIRSARREFWTWPTTDDTIFARLRIWAAGKRDLIPGSEFGTVIQSLSDSAFWNSRHQRDLLLVLADRWNELDETARKHIESRLLAGPERWDGEEENRFVERKAWSILDRVHWLSNRGCALTFDLGALSESLGSDAPQWKAEYGEKAAESLEGRSGFVQTKTEHSALLSEPISSILSRARELSGRAGGGSFVENDPYAGLAAEHPVRAFSALTHAAKLNEFPEWAWQKFLNPGARKNDGEKFLGLIAKRLVSYSEQAIATLIRPASDWLLSVSKIFADRYPAIFDKLIEKLVGALRLDPDGGRSGIVRGSREPDWVMEAINAPTGKIAQALFDDPRLNNLETEAGLPAAWLYHVNSLLTLSDDMRRHAIVIFFHRLNWFYAIDAPWTEDKLLSIFNGRDEQDREAAWGGFLWGTNVPNQKLYVRLKPELLALAVKPIPSRRSSDDVISGIILAGWGSTDEKTGERFISNEEMRNLLLNANDEFRSHVLWQVQRWSDADETATSERWSDLLPEFLEKVWPRQVAAKSPTISARLCDLAFSDEKQFPKLVDIILPLLTKINRDELRLSYLFESKDGVVDLYPEKTLALLDAALPDNATAWPYGIEGVLQRIGDADKNLNTDERLITLRRRWDSR